MKDMKRSERRNKTANKVRQREKLMSALGKKSGSLYEKHRDKIEASSGYMRDGNLSHYADTYPSKKTKVTGSRRWSGPSWNRKHYGSKFNYNPHDKRQVDNMEEY